MNTGKRFFVFEVFFSSWNLMLFCSKILCMQIFVSAAFWVGFGSLFAWEPRLLVERRGGFRWPQQLRSVFSSSLVKEGTEGQAGEGGGGGQGGDVWERLGVRGRGQSCREERVSVRLEAGCRVRPGGVVQGWGQAAGAGRVGSCRGSEGSKRGGVGWETGLWLRRPLGEEAFPPLLSCLAARLTDLRVGTLRDYCFCSTTSFLAPVLAVSADKWLAHR